MAEKLKPCPLCGAKARRDRLATLHFVYCANCKVQTALYHDKVAADAIWNTRTEAPQQ